MNPWKVLGIKPTDNREEVKKAYDSKFKKMNSFSREEYNQLIQAYSQALEQVETFEHEEAAYGKSPSLMKAVLHYQNADYARAPAAQADGLKTSQEKVIDAGQETSAASKPFYKKTWYKVMMAAVMIFALYRIMSFINAQNAFYEKNPQYRSSQQAKEAPLSSEDREAPREVSNINVEEAAARLYNKFGRFKLEDAGDGTQTLKDRDKVVATGITRAIKLENYDYYLETAADDIWITGVDKRFGELDFDKIGPAWIKSKESSRPNALVVQSEDNSLGLVLAEDRINPSRIYPVSGTPNLKEDQTVDILGEPGSYSFAP